MITNKPNEPKKDYTQENENFKNAIIYEFTKDWKPKPKVNGFQAIGYVMLIILIIIILL